MIAFTAMAEVWRMGEEGLYSRTVQSASRWSCAEAIESIRTVKLLLDPSFCETGRSYGEVLIRMDCSVLWVDPEQLGDPVLACLAHQGLRPFHGEPPDGQKRPSARVQAVLARYAEEGGKHGKEGK